MQLQIELENIKCGGCAATIKKRLLEDARIKSVDVDVATGAVTLDATENDLVSWKALLLKLGYPQRGTAEGVAAAKAMAKSFVSCAIGRVDNAKNKKR
ncbi:MAG: heavy-metal-associated domain-containing protein [Gammaproteobacteria bacterium]|nr:heavy-metal-associated domain-containing protein [Gammaproteobacteria bacterium]